jgi:hypothetical protein
MLCRATAKAGALRRADRASIADNKMIFPPITRTGRRERGTRKGEGEGKEGENNTWREDSKNLSGEVERK